MIDGDQQIDTFEKKQGLHGPGYMTRKELREVLRTVEPRCNLGIDIKTATHQELVAAYRLWQQMVEDGIVSPPPSECGSSPRYDNPPSPPVEFQQQQQGASSTPEASEVEQLSESLAKEARDTLASSTQAQHGTPAKDTKLTFRTRKEDTGAVKRLTPRSGSQLVGFFGDNK